MSPKKINIAIDGYSGTGKSSTAKEVASQLSYTYLDSGAMYRAVTLYFIRSNVNYRNNKAVDEALRNIRISFSFNRKTKKFDTCLNGKNVETEIRSMIVSEKVSDVSTIGQVRTNMVAIQRDLGKEKGVIMDGRDIGTVVFPEAELKIFMSADIEVRAKRRQLELQEKGLNVDLDEVLRNLEERDRIDSTRKISPLKKAEDAVEINTSQLNFKQQVDEIIKLARQKTG